MDFFRYLYSNYDINFSVLFKPYDMSMFISGIKYTFLMAIVSILFSLLIGFIGAYFLKSRHSYISFIPKLYVTLFRNTPPLIQLYFFFFAVGPALTSLLGYERPVLNALIWALISLSLFAGSFNVEIFRSGIEAVEGSMLESAKSLGLTHSQIFRKITLPLAIRISFPALVSNLVHLIKVTCEAFAIAVPGVLYVSAQVWSREFNVLEMMVVLLLFFIIVDTVFVYLCKLIEAKIAVPGWGTL